MLRLNIKHYFHFTLANVHGSVRQSRTDIWPENSMSGSDTSSCWHKLPSSMNPSVHPHKLVRRLSVVHCVFWTIPLSDGCWCPSGFCDPASALVSSPFLFLFSFCVKLTGISLSKAQFVFCDSRHQQLWQCTKGWDTWDVLLANTNKF